MNVLCDHCDGPLPKRRHRFCSDACARAWRPAVLPCDTCGAPLPRGRRRFCSDACARREAREQRVTPTDEYLGALTRQIRRVGQRAATDLDAMTWLGGARALVRSALVTAIDGARAFGYSDPEIAAALGISRNALGQQYGRKHDPCERDVHGGQPAGAAADGQVAPARGAQQTALKRGEGRRTP